MNQEPQPEEAATSAQLHDHRVEFTGSGSEYFRIWIVNLLLLLLTLGLYLPWAKARKLRYFYGNTLVDGDPLDFLGEPKKMFRGLLIAGLFLGLYSKALDVSLVAWTVATVALLAVWPALFRASMQFRLANTSWRGLRFRFTGDMPGAYQSVGLALALVLVPFGLIRWFLIPDQPKAVPNVQAIGTAYALTLLLIVVFMPYLFWRIKHYQHNHYSFGSERAELRIGPKSIYAVIAKTVGLMILVVVVMSTITGVMAFSMGRGQVGAGFAATLFLQVVLGFVLFNVLIRCYWTVAVQNLIWSRTGNNRLRFISRLSFKSYFRLQLRNYALIVLTLGLYWPFAVIASKRMVLESMTLRTRGLSLDALSSQAAHGHEDAAGDAAVDLFGMDVGL